MLKEEKIKMFKDVFAPKPNEKILFLIDAPHNDIKDNKSWKERREMAKEWYEDFKNLGKEEGFSVEFIKYKATGQHNSPVPKEITDLVSHVDLILAMTEYSGTSSFGPICREESSKIRGASMPGIEKRMEETALKADYADVQRYATVLKNMLNEAIGAEILFSNDDRLYLDLRNRIAKAEAGECIKPRQFINFPSGEGFIAPYEGASDEIDQFGPSKTKGVLPIDYDGELVKYVVENNVIVDIVGDGEKAKEMTEFFNENKSRKNIAELGIGCNPKAVITGNVLEDEKVGLHIAYGLSRHLGGKVDSDVHQDICYSKGCPIEGTTLTLINEDGSKIELIQNAMLRYDLLK